MLIDDLFYGIRNQVGWPNWVAILLVSNNAYMPHLWHQYGGVACLHIKLQGSFVWLQYPAPQYPALDMETGGWHLNDLTEIATILPDSATLDTRAPAYEALVPVKWQGQDAWLIWENSD